MIRYRYKTMLLFSCVLMTACAATSQKTNDVAASNVAKTHNISSTAATSIRVSGTGKTFQEALLNGFSIAAQQKIGNVITSSKDIINDKLVVDEILDYSSGYVERYTIHSSESHADHHVIDMTVWVLDSRIAQRVLSTNNKADNINGFAISKSYESFKINIIKAETLLKSVLRDYPRRAFDIKQENYRVRFDAARNVVIEFPYHISWNNNYLSALKEALHYSSLNYGKKAGTPYDPSVDNMLRYDFYKNYNKSDYYGKVIIDADDYIIGSSFYIPDAEHFRVILNAFGNNNRRVMASTMYFASNEKTRKETICHEFIKNDSIMRYEDNYLQLKSNKSHEYFFSVLLDEPGIRTLVRIEIAILSAEECESIKRSQTSQD